MPTVDDVDLGYAYTLKPEEAIKYFESKGYVIGFRWHDVKDIAHARAFTVAGVLKLDVLKDIRDGLTAGRSGSLPHNWSRCWRKKAGWVSG